MNAFARDKTPFYLDDLLATMCVNHSPTGQQVADITHVHQRAEQQVGWFIKLTAASFGGWQRNGQHPISALGIPDWSDNTKPVKGPYGSVST